VRNVIARGGRLAALASGPGNIVAGATVDTATAPRERLSINGRV
jgi:hypothetical protein